MESRIMALSYNSITSGAAGGEDFTVSIGSSGYTKSDLGKNFGEGNYICTSSLSDATLDIYFLNEDGSVSGYANATTATTTIVVSQSFRYVVIYGATNNDTLTFQYKTVVSPTSQSSSDIEVGPKIISVATSSLPNQDNTTVVSGYNFATDVTITFSSSTPGYTPIAAKSVVRSSSTSLTITRPDNMPPAYSPYTITASNPGRPNPTSSNVHILSNCITAGVAPVWVTSATLPTFTRNSSYSTTIQATDADGGSSVSYSYVSGSLPTGISFNAATATFSGTPTTALTTTYTVRATDSGGNYVDRTFTLTNASPTWSTTSPLSVASVGSAYSVTVTATDDSGTTPTYSILSGSLPSGLSLNTSTGAITGTPSSAPAQGTSFVLRATDANGYTADRTFLIPFPRTATFTSSGTFTTSSTTSSVDTLIVAGGGGGGHLVNAWGPGGGGGGGLLYYTNLAVTPSTDYAITVGSGGSKGSRGGNSSAFGYTAQGGGLGGTDNNSAGGSGGSGGGGGAYGGSGGAGTSGQGYNGSNGTGGGGPGGGAGGTGGTGGGLGGPGLANSISGSSYTYSKGGNGGLRYETATTAYGDGGYGGNPAPSGVQGIVIVKYNA
jgi:hypothetical protein